VPIYLCPISGSAPRVPVLTNETITYDFVSIALNLLRENTDNNPIFNFNLSLDPVTCKPIDTLTYNRSTKELNDALMEEVLPLSNKEKSEIASLYTQLTNRYPALKICGIHTLEGMQAILGAPMPATQIVLRPEFEPNFVDEDGRTALYLAAQEGLVDVVRRLLASDEVRPNQGMTLERLHGSTPLMAAVEKGHLLAVMTLLSDPRVEPNQAKADGATPLFIAAQQRHLPVVTALLASGAAINQAKANGATPLCIAAQNGHLPVVTALLDAGADINHAITDGATPLFIAAQNGHLPVVTALLDAGADINHAMTDGATPLCFAAQQRHLPVVTALLDAGADINHAMTDGATSLCIAAQNGHLPVVTALLASGAAINQAKANGATPLFIAAQNGHLPVVTALLDAGADINHAMTDGATPLYTAVLFGHLEVVQALQRHQHATMAHPPISIATQQGYPAFVKALLLEETVRDYYLNQIIIKPKLMHNAFTQNPVFFTELATHRNALWARLRGPAHFNLAPDAHKTLLETILNSRQVPDETQRHPLHVLFGAPQPAGWFSFFSRTVNITLDDIQAYTDDTYPGPTPSI